MSLTSTAQATWLGSLADGKGNVSLDSSGAANLRMTWKARAEEHASGVTNPEELIGAAHASCFSMALVNMLTQEGGEVESVNTSADVTFNAKNGIEKIHLVTVARVAGVDADQFQTIAQRAKKDCPVSRALKGVDIELTASLA